MQDKEVFGKVIKSKKYSEPFADRFKDNFSERTHSHISMHVGDDRISNVLFSGTGGVELTRSSNDENNEGKIFLKENAISLRLRKISNSFFSSDIIDFRLILISTYQINLHNYRPEETQDINILPQQEQLSNWNSTRK